MEPLHGLSLNPTPSSLSASQTTSPTRYFMVIWRNLDFPFSEPKKLVFFQRRCKVRAHPRARGNFHACYIMLYGHSREVGIHLVVQAYTVFLLSHDLVKA